MARPRPSLERVRWQGLREIIDAAFIDKVRELEDAYYGTALSWQSDGGVRKIDRALDGWSHGVSHPFTFGGKVFDKSSTNQDPKVLFDQLHGAIWLLYSITLYSLNEVRGKPEGDIHLFVDEINPVEVGNKVTYDKVVVDRKVEDKAKLLEISTATGFNPSTLADELVAPEALPAVRALLA